MAHRDVGQCGASFLPSPTASSATSISTPPESLLPQMRSHPLVPGSQKEVAFIEHVDARILQITRRYAKKFSKEKGNKDEAPGYENFAQCVSDLETVFNVVWISGTPISGVQTFSNVIFFSLRSFRLWDVPFVHFRNMLTSICLSAASLQVPYLLSLAGLFSSYLPAFPFAPVPTFRIAKRLDTAFAYLLKRPLASENRVLTSSQDVSPTDKVRIKSLISATRVAAVETAEKSGHSPSAMDVLDEEDTEEEEDEPEIGDEEENGEFNHDLVSRGLSKIFQQTLELLGDDLV